MNFFLTKVIQLEEHFFFFLQISVNCALMEMGLKDASWISWAFSNKMNTDTNKLFSNIITYSKVDLFYL